MREVLIGFRENAGVTMSHQNGHCQRVNAALQSIRGPRMSQRVQRTPRRYFTRTTLTEFTLGFCAKVGFRFRNELTAVPMLFVQLFHKRVKGVFSNGLPTCIQNAQSHAYDQAIECAANGVLVPRPAVSVPEQFPGRVTLDECLCNSRGGGGR